MDLKHCSHCNKGVKILRKSYCAACYARVKRNGTPEYEQVNRRTRQTECSFCGKPGNKLVKGLCKPCYYRDKKNGDLEYRKVRTLCRVPGCDAVVKSDGLCGKHHLRIQKTGTTDEPRGGKTAHPQYERWQWYYRNKSMCHPRWHDFWNFADDVGEAPSTIHRLYRIDTSLPYGPGNFEWRERTLDEAGSQKKADYAKAWRAAYVVKNPRRFKNYELGRYSLTIESFEAMLAKQNGVCAICEQKETAVHQTTGEPRHLAVDHCHAKLHVRGLLCTQCNRMIGLSRDKPDILRKAADYLEYHDSLVGSDSPPE